MQAATSDFCSLGGFPLTQGTPRLCRFKLASSAFVRQEKRPRQAQNLGKLQNWMSAYKVIQIIVIGCLCAFLAFFIWFEASFYLYSRQYIGQDDLLPILLKLAFCAQIGRVAHITYNLKFRGSYGDFVLIVIIMIVSVIINVILSFVSIVIFNESSGIGKLTEFIIYLGLFNILPVVLIKRNLLSEFR